MCSSQWSQRWLFEVVVEVAGTLSIVVLFDVVVVVVPWCSSPMRECCFSSIRVVLLAWAQVVVGMEAITSHT